MLRFLIIVSLFNIASDEFPLWCPDCFLFISIPFNKNIPCAVYAENGLLNARSAALSILGFKRQKIRFSGAWPQWAAKHQLHLMRSEGMISRAMVGCQIEPKGAHIGQEAADKVKSAENQQALPSRERSKLWSKCSRGLDVHQCDRLLGKGDLRFLGHECPPVLMGDLANRNAGKPQKAKELSPNCAQNMSKLSKRI